MLSVRLAFGFFGRRDFFTLVRLFVELGTGLLRFGDVCLVFYYITLELVFYRSSGAFLSMMTLGMTTA